MNEEFIIRQQELVENPTPRVPICLVLDVSGSMSGDPIEELQEGVRMFFDAIREDDVAQYAAEIAIVTFGGVARKALDFSRSIVRKFRRCMQMGAPQWERRWTFPWIFSRQEKRNTAMPASTITSRGWC